MSDNIVLKKAEVIITINSNKRQEFENVQLINVPLLTDKPDKPNVSINYWWYEKGSKEQGETLATGPSPYSNPKFFGNNQIIINNLDPGFNPLQITLVGKNYNSNFATNSINFFDNFNINLDKNANTLTLTNIISKLTGNNTDVTAQFGRNPEKPHIIGKIIILYDMEYNDF
jgi:hypothetical protein